MKKLCFIFILLLAGVAGVSAQSSECQFSSGCVTVSRAVAEKALVDAETVKAQAAEIAALKQALSDEKAVAEKLKLEFAEKSGENTALRQNDVANRAIIELLVKKVGKKCSPLSILCL